MGLAMSPMNTWVYVLCWGWRTRLFSHHTEKAAFKIVKFNMKCLLTSCYSININLLSKQHFPLLWLMCVGVYWVLDLPSKSWAYWGNPAARSQSHASFASISETQQSACFKNGDLKGKRNHIKVFIFILTKPWEHQPKKNKLSLCTW